MSDPYPFESGDDLQITELTLEDVDAVAEAAITVGQLVSEHESWRFGHVIVDEAQDLTPMQWRMVMRRVRGSSLTIVGDLAQRTTPVGGPARSWSELLPREIGDVERQDLTINYRSPAPINDVASGVLAQLSDDIVASTSVRAEGQPVDVRSGSLDDLPALVDELLMANDGRLAVIGTTVPPIDHERVAVLRPPDAKGLEFDVVVVVEPSAIVELVGGPAHLYVALTRATRHLVVLHEQPLPALLATALRA